MALTECCNAVPHTPMPVPVCRTKLCLQCRHSTVKSMWRDMPEGVADGTTAPWHMEQLYHHLHLHAPLNTSKNHTI